MTCRRSRIYLTVSFFALIAACSSSPGSTGTGGSGGNQGTGGSTGAGGTAGAGGTGGATGAGGAAGAAGFRAVNPCNAAGDYVTGNTVMFGGMVALYTPQCLRVSAGTTVTFNGGSSTFAMHPLMPSGLRGDTVGNPITATTTGDTSKSFTFTTPGFFAYFCMVHGATDSGAGMAGVVWVE
jgi:plastocyanin